MTANEVCEWLRIDRKAPWELEKSPKLILDRIGRCLRYREHEVIEFLDCEREKQAVNFGRLSARPAETREGDGQLSRPASKEFTSGLSLGTSKLGMGVSERDIAAINPVSGRSIYASVYTTLTEGHPVSEINAESAGDTE